jgi:hypothetical protein
MISFWPEDVEESIEISDTELTGKTIEEVIPIVLKKFGWNPEMKLNFSYSCRFFSLPHELFTEWRQQRAELWVTEIKPQIEILQQGIAIMIDRDDLERCRTAEDLAEYARDQGWIDEEQAVDIEIDDWDADNCERGTIIFNHNFINTIEFTYSANSDSSSESDVPLDIDKSCPLLTPQDVTCVICHEVLFATNCREVRRIEKCGHHFHAKCIEEWFKTAKTCPLCRTVIL